MSDEPDDPGRVYATCPECKRSHTVIWPMRNPDAVDITCTERCGAEMTVARDGEVAVDG